jgi:hypothetical protein
MIYLDQQKVGELREWQLVQVKSENEELGKWEAVPVDQLKEAESEEGEEEEEERVYQDVVGHP